MLRLGIACAALLTSTAAMAGSISYDFRFDFRSDAWDSQHTQASATPGVNNGYRFTVPVGRLDFKGKLDEALDYRLRMRFDNFQNDPTNPTQTTNLTQMVDLAYVRHNINDMFNVTLGKFLSDMGGAEGIDSTADQYLFSDIYSDMSAAGGTTSTKNGGVGTSGAMWTGTGMAIKNSLDYAGVKVAGVFGDHEVAIHYANATEDSYAPGTAAAAQSQYNVNNNQGWLAVVYKGKFFDNVWKPVLSYHVGPSYLGTAGPGANRTYLAFGNWINVAGWQIEADYLSNTYKDNGTSTVSGFTGTLTGFDVQVGYDLGNWLPKLKYASAKKSVSSTLAGGTTENVGSSAYGVVVEYKPKTENNFRYHLAYMNYTYTPDNSVSVAGGPAGQNLTDTQIIAGCRIDGDFLK